MKSNFERNQIRIQYGKVSLVLLLICVVWSCFGFWGKWWLVGMNIVFFLVADYALFRLTYHRMDYLLTEMEQVADIMLDVVDEKDTEAAEQYKEGTVGILNTNLFKMVHILRESKEKAQKEKCFLRDIISDISHQLKTPLAALNVFMDLLVDGKVTEQEKQKQMLMESKNQLNRLEWMVLSMLKLARIEAGAIVFEQHNTQVAALLYQAESAVQYLTKERRQTVIVECEEELQLSCDAGWLTEAIINLLKNASDYSEEGKRIWLTVEQNNIYTRIYVKDEGMGIPKEELPNIFNRFYRVHQEVNPNSVGIGLSLAKSIIEGMGGRITVRSEAGSYTWFILTFMK